METTAGAPWWLYAVAVIFLIFFGVFQFNRWTDGELKADDVLSVAPPKYFTSFGRFSMMALLYCLCLLAFYGVVVALFMHKEWSEGYLKVAGVTPGNAWLAGLFAATGLSNVLPPFTTIESVVRKTLHRWAFVPIKAKTLASQMADVNTTFTPDRTYIERIAVQHAGNGFTAGDFIAGPAENIANKWCRLIYLLNKFAPLGPKGQRQWETNSPYVISFNETFFKLQRRVQDLALKSDPLLRLAPIPPEGNHMSERIDDLLQELYLLMSVSALGSKLSWDAVQAHFLNLYGINVRAPSEVTLPSSSVFNALALVAVITFIATFIYKLVTKDALATPVVWALCALGTHGCGVWAGWLTFSMRRRGERAVVWGQHSRRFRAEYFSLAIILGFTLALPFSWLGSVYFDHIVLGFSLRESAPKAFTLAWPWAFLGSATAAAILMHLEYTVDTEIDLRTKLISGIGQALMNMTIAISVIAVQVVDPSVQIPGGPETLAAALSTPLYDFVIFLTGLIGLCLGFTIPSAFKGHARERRIAVRHEVVRPTNAMLSVGTLPSDGQLIDVSGTGGLIRIAQPVVVPGAKQVGCVTFEKTLELPAQYVRVVSESASHCDVALWFSSDHQFFHLPKKLRRQLDEFIARVTTVKAPSV